MCQEIEITTVSVSFWLGEDCVLDCFSTTYPHYHVGDTIWLEREVIPHTRFGSGEIEPLRLTEFKVIGVHHSVSKTYGNRITTTIKMEVLLQRAEN